MKAGTRTVLGAAAVFAAISFISVQTPAQQKLAAKVNDAAGGALDGTAPSPVSGPGSGAGAVTGHADPGQAASGDSVHGAVPQAASYECAAGKNGGPTDRGVSANKIKLASTEVLSGEGSSFLGASHVGMEAVVADVNAAGGICGRLLDLTLRDDGWEASLGASFLGNFVSGSPAYFALPVVPSSEGLTQAITSRIIDNGQTPVVGSDGMLQAQYQDPWVWPVATSTASTMRIMAKHAYDVLGARSFGIVWDSHYRFGKEGAAAFAQYVQTLPGAHLAANIPVVPGQPSYPQVDTFNEGCGGKTSRCDFVAMLLEPGTALAWINSMGDDKSGRRLGFGSKGTGGAQTLFNTKFAQQCGEPCSGMLLWTGYNPPIGEKQNLPGLAKYVSDVKAIDPGVDPDNQFVEGAYLGMTVLVEALKQAGPNLTRVRLRQVLDGFRYASDLSSPLAFAPGRHDANQGAQAYEVRTAAGSFSGFADAGTGFLADPTHGVFPGGD
jgi:ABC-type branched-subunit amino acid transport system substrate-binding protein